MLSAGWRRKRKVHPDAGGVLPIAWTTSLLKVMIRFAGENI